MGKQEKGIYGPTPKTIQAGIKPDRNEKSIRGKQVGIAIAAGLFAGGVGIVEAQQQQPPEPTPVAVAFAEMNVRNENIAESLGMEEVTESQLIEDIQALLELSDQVIQDLGVGRVIFPPQLGNARELYLIGSDQRPTAFVVGLNSELTVVQGWQQNPSELQVALGIQTTNVRVTASARIRASADISSVQIGALNTEDIIGVYGPFINEKDAYQWYQLTLEDGRIGYVADVSLDFSNAGIEVQDQSATPVASEEDNSDVASLPGSSEDANDLEGSVVEVTGEIAPMFTELEGELAGYYEFRARILEILEDSTNADVEFRQSTALDSANDGAGGSADGLVYAICEYESNGITYQIAVPLAILINGGTYISGENLGMADDQILNENDAADFLKNVGGIKVGDNINITITARNDIGQNARGNIQTNYFGRTLEQIYRELPVFLASGDPSDLPNIGKFDNVPILFPEYIEK